MKPTIFLPTVSLPTAPRILVTRLSAIGDSVHAMPIVGAIKAYFPQAHIAWVTQSGPASLLAGYPGLDEVICVPRDWMKSLRSIRQIRHQLRQRRFDVAVDPQSLTKSSLLGRLSGARYRVGFASPQGRELSRWWNNIRVVPKSEHVVIRYLELLEPLGIVSPAVRFEMRVSQSPRINQFLAEHGLAKQRFAVVNPGAGWGSKVWPVERYAAVVSYLGQRHAMPSVVVWAGQQEFTWAEQIVQQSHGHGRLAPDTSLVQLRQLLATAGLCVAGDTGPLHIAAALQTPCVGLYGPTAVARCGPLDAGNPSAPVVGGRHRTVQPPQDLAGATSMRSCLSRRAVRSINRSSSAESAAS